jgi:protein-L-isoaspartate O-methyltransferase
VPEGVHEQELVVYEKRADGELRRTSVHPVRFVPMTGKAQERK